MTQKPGLDSRDGARDGGNPDMARLNERQVSLLLTFRELHYDGLKFPPYHVAFGMSRLSLGGEGQPLSGLIRRGLVREDNNIFYITDEGLAAIQDQTS